MVVRELLARFGIGYDRNGLSKFEGAVARAKKAVGALAAAWASWQVVQKVKEAIERANDAASVIDTLAPIFKEAEQSVLGWADTTSRELRRSESRMLDYVTQVGAMVAPTFESKLAAAELSGQMVELAVNMGSFFSQYSETEALTAIRSALSGETEAIKKFGPVMTVENQERFRRERGIRKSLKAMKESERVTLRAQFLLEKLAFVEGHAAANTDGYSLAVVGLTEAQNSLWRHVGTFLLRPATRMTTWLRDGLIWFRELSERTGLLERSLRALGIAAGAAASVVAVRLAPAILASTWPIVAAAAAIAALVLWIDDLYTAFTGGDSQIGAWMEALLGEQEWRRIREQLMDFGAWVHDVVHDIDGARSSFLDDWLNGFEQLGGVGKGVLLALSGLVLAATWPLLLMAAKIGLVTLVLEHLYKLFRGGQSTLSRWGEAIGEWFGKAAVSVSESLDAMVADIGRWHDETNAQFEVWAGRVYDWLTRPFRDAWKVIEEGWKGLKQTLSAGINTDSFVTEAKALLGFSDTREGKATRPAHVASRPLSGSASSGGSVVNRTTNANVTNNFHVSGAGNPAAVAQSVVAELRRHSAGALVEGAS